jgi:hypothetical protein
LFAREGQLAIGEIVIQHVVMMKFAAGADAAQRAECVRRMAALPEQIDFLKEYTVGVDELNIASSWDVGMLIRFDSMEQLTEFRDHPAHRSAQQYSMPHIASMASVVFELASAPAR